MSIRSDIPRIERDLQALRAARQVAVESGASTVRIDASILALERSLQQAQAQGQG